MLNLKASLEEYVEKYGSDSGSLLHQVVIDLVYLKQWMSVSVPYAACVMATQYPGSDLQAIIPVRADSVSSMQSLQEAIDQVPKDIPAVINIAIIGNDSAISYYKVGQAPFEDVDNSALRKTG